MKLYLSRLDVLGIQSVYPIYAIDLLRFVRSRV